MFHSGHILAGTGTSIAQHLDLAHIIHISCYLGSPNTVGMNMLGFITGVGGSGLKIIAGAGGLLRGGPLMKFCRSFIVSFTGAS